MCWAAFFLASAGASSAYLTVSEIFPMETRALAIALFFAVGTATGGIVGPELFGQLINSGSKHLVAIGFFVGAGAMALGGVAELLFGVRAEQQSLENIAKPLTVEDAEALVPLPLAPEVPPIPRPTTSSTKRCAAREQAEDERAVAAERRAALQELRSREPDAGRPRSRAGRNTRRRSPSSARRASTSWPPRTRSGPRHCTPRRRAARRAAFERAAAAEQRARSYEERAQALAAEGTPRGRAHALLAEAAAERAREREQRALAEEARAEAEHLLGASRRPRTGPRRDARTLGGCSRGKGALAGGQAAR